MGVNHAHGHDPEEAARTPEEAARERARRFAAALEAVLRDHAEALRQADAGVARPGGVVTRD